MNFREAIDLVGDQTVRPELDRLIRARINSFIRMISLSGRYWPDRVEGTLSVTTKASSFSFATPARFRAIDYIYFNDLDRHIDIKEPAQIYRDPTSETDRYYLAGNNIIIVTSRETDTFRYAYWQYPQDLVEDDDTNWIMTNLGITVVDMVSQVIYGNMGENVETSFFSNLQAAELQILVEDVLRTHTATVMSGRL